tara:strand:+ start:298 stop:432 length:135 start_codon:yes stop_codon:yes gene_type:complete
MAASLISASGFLAFLLDQARGDRYGVAFNDQWPESRNRCFLMDV